MNTRVFVAWVDLVATKAGFAAIKVVPIAAEIDLARTQVGRTGEKTVYAATKFAATIARVVPVVVVVVLLHYLPLLV